MNVTDCSAERDAVGIAVTLLALLVTGIIVGLLLDAKYNYPGGSAGGADDSRYAVDAEELLQRDGHAPEPTEEVLHRFVPESCPPDNDDSDGHSD